MRATVISLIILILAAAGPGRADDRTADRAGAFDYYLLALSWNAAWCEAEGAGQGAPQCDPFGEIGFVLHGLWPQDEDGWPEYCRTAQRDPSRAETAAMADIMGSAGAAWYQWKKHGRCSGLDPREYFALARAAWDAVKRPEVLRRVRLPRRIAPEVIEQAFIEVNPDLEPEGVTVTCRGRRFREVRICLNRDLTPRRCAGATARDCRAATVLFAPMR